MQVAQCVQKLTFYNKRVIFALMVTNQLTKNSILDKIDRSPWAGTQHLGLCPLPSSRPVFTGGLFQPTWHLRGEQSLTWQCQIHSGSLFSPKGVDAYTCPYPCTSLYWGACDLASLLGWPACPAIKTCGLVFHCFSKSSYWSFHVLTTVLVALDTSESPVCPAQVRATRTLPQVCLVLDTSLRYGRSASERLCWPSTKLAGAISKKTWPVPWWCQGSYCLFLIGLPHGIFNSGSEDARASIWLLPYLILFKCPVPELFPIFP